MILYRRRPRFCRCLFPKELVGVWKRTQYNVVGSLNTIRSGQAWARKNVGWRIDVPEIDNATKDIATPLGREERHQGRQREAVLLVDGERGNDFFKNPCLTYGRRYDFEISE